MTKTYVNKAMLARQEHDKELLRRFYDLGLPIGIEQDNLTEKVLSPLVGEEPPSTKWKRLMDTLIELGIVTRRISYGKLIHEPTGRPIGGRIAHITVNMSFTNALVALETFHASEREATNHPPDMSRRWAKPETKVPASAAITDAGLAIRRNGEEPVEAITGPEPERPFAHLGELRKDEPRALVEAARQYKRRHKMLAEKVAELAALAAEMGVTFDEPQIMSQFEYKADERLEAVSLVLPYIDQLEQENARILRTNVDYREKAKAYDQIVAENNRQTKRIDQLIAENTQLKRMAV